MSGIFRKEIFRLGILFCFLFGLLIIIELKLPVFIFLKATPIEFLLTSQSFTKICSGLILSLLAALIFYIVIDVIPRRRRRDNRVNFILDRLLASILDSYIRRRMFGHETALPYVSIESLKPYILKDHIKRLKENDCDKLALKFSLDTAHVRESDFRHCLTLAVNLSPEKALQWLVITDKVRLLAENYNQQPETENATADLRDHDSPLSQYYSVLSFRLMEYLEEALKWMRLKD